MLRKILTSFFIVLLLAIIVLGYLYLQKQKEYKGVDPFSAIPVNSELIVQFESLEQLITKLENNTGAWQELSKFEKIAKINENLQFIDSLAGNIGSDHQFTLDRSFTMASHLQGKMTLNTFTFCQYWIIWKKRNWKLLFRIGLDQTWYCVNETIKTQAYTAFLQPVKRKKNCTLPSQKVCSWPVDRCYCWKTLFDS